jgi:hypothetical protein
MLLVFNKEVVFLLKSLVANSNSNQLPPKHFQILINIDLYKMIKKFKKICIIKESLIVVGKK